MRVATVSVCVTHRGGVVRRWVRAVWRRPAPTVRTAAARARRGPTGTTSFFAWGVGGYRRVGCRIIQGVGGSGGTPAREPEARGGGVGLGEAWGGLSGVSE